MEKDINVILEELRKPFSHNEVRYNYQGHPYVTFSTVLDRLNNVVGVQNFSLNVLDEKILETSAAVKLEIVIFIGGKEFRKTAWGTHVSSRQAVDAAEALNSLKSAQSDAFKKVCQYLGIPSVINAATQQQPQRKASGGYNNQNPQYNNTTQQQNPQYNNNRPQQQTPQNDNNSSANCSDCGFQINSGKVIQYSTKKFGRTLCYNCQKKQ